MATNRKNASVEKKATEKGIITKKGTQKRGVHLSIPPSPRTRSIYDVSVPIVFRTTVRIEADEGVVCQADAIAIRQAAIRFCRDVCLGVLPEPNDSHWKYEFCNILEDDVAIDDEDEI